MGAAVDCEVENMKKYDIFISYRRNLGAETAKHLRDVLQAKGYRVFFDTDTLSSGNFNMLDEAWWYLNRCGQDIVFKKGE